MSRERERDDSVVAVSSRWNFLKRRIPDFLQDSIQSVLDLVESLPFLSEEQKRELMDRIRSERDIKGSS